MKNTRLYKWFREWTGKRKRTDIWRAATYLVLIVLVLLAATGCTNTGPQMTIAVSSEGDGFVRLTQPLYEAKAVSCFAEYEHFSEIMRETNEVTGDFGLIGCRYQFGQWKFLQR